MKLVNFFKYSFNKYVRKSFWGCWSIVASVISIIFIFVPLQYDGKDYRFIALGMFLVISVLIFIINAAVLSNKRSVKLVINNTKVKVVYGSIFDNKKFGNNTYRIVGFNEYFDTHLGDGVIDVNTLNGLYLKRYDLSCRDLDDRIASDKLLQSEIAPTDGEREYKKIKYNLGSIFVDKKTDFILVALSHFDKNNNAVLTNAEMINCFMTMWSKIRIAKESRSIVLPLLGGGSNIQGDNPLSHQEILEALLETYKLSNVQIKEPQSLTIVLNERVREKFNFQRLRERF